MTEPVDRVTPISDFDLWTALYAQWVDEREPSYIVRRAGGASWKVIQHTSGSIVFDPQDNVSLRDSTGFP